MMNSQLWFVKNRNQKINIETVVKAISYTTGIIGFLAIFKYVNIFFSIAFLVLLTLSLYFDYIRKNYLPRWILNAVSIIVIISSFYRFDAGDLVAQIIEALLILLSIKFLEEKKFRDYMQIYAIVLFLLAGLGLLSLDIIFAFYLFVLVILLTISIVLLTYYSQDPYLQISGQMVIKIVLKSMYIPLLAIPLTIAMFIILPRTHYPVFNFLNRADKAKTGFTDNVRLGGVSGIQEDSSTILRVNMEKIDDNLLYWRGVVLDYFDGNSWKSLRKKTEFQTENIEVNGKRISQIVYLEPYENKYLFALDKPVLISLRAIRKNRDLTYSLQGYVEKRIRYEAVSVISDTVNDDLTDGEAYLQVPENIPFRIKDLVQSVSSGRDIEEDMRLIYGFLNNGSFKYSLENLPVSRTPLEDFLFNVKSGNCEYFASAYAIMLRIAGIPSRLVGGYRGGYYNNIGGYYIVPQKNAHVWVEAYVKNKGRKRIDPTPAGAEAFSLPVKGVNLLFRMNMFIDTINYYWFSFVINYNFERQLNILNSFRRAFKKSSISITVNKKRAIEYGIVIFLAAAAMSAVYLIVIKSLKRETAEKQILLRFLNRMEKLGYRKNKSQGLEEFVLTIENCSVRMGAMNFVREFEKLFYQDRAFRENNIKDLKKMIDVLDHKNQ
ncbi:MAG TPA: hypothetical protein DCY00_06285 [Actinobacteria bacterium]|nr:hypothetical protein [Actinomycetota bacterium]